MENQKHAHGQEHQEKTRHAFKSLLAIVCILFGSYVSFGIALQIIPMLVTDSVTQYVLFHVCGQLVAISSTLNAPVLYFCR
jgi:hypothetical protein